jgi:hypothetical protein
MPRRKTDATNDDVAPPEPPDNGAESRPGPEEAAEPLPPAGAESEPEPRAEPVEAVTVDETTPGTHPLPEPAPLAEERRPPEEEHHYAEEEPGWSLPARVLTALVLLLAGAGLGIWAAPKLAPMLPSGMDPVADWLTPGADDAEAEVAALRAQLDQGLSGVEARFADLPSAGDVDQRVSAAVGAARDELAAEVAALRQSVGQIDAAATRQRLDRLDATLQGQAGELTALKQQLQAASGQLSQEAVQQIDVYSAEVQGLRDQMRALQDQVSGLAARIDEVAANAEQQIATARSRVGEIQTRAATELGAAETQAAVALVRAAVASGQPFAAPLEELAARGAAIPEGLTAAAASGVPTLAQLRDRFPDAAHAAIRASIMASAGDGVFARSRAFLKAQVASRSLTPQPGASPDAVLSRMEERLRQGDLGGVLAESAALPSEAAAAMAGWLDAAKLRLGAETGLAQLDAAPAATN